MTDARPYFSIEKKIASYEREKARKREYQRRKYKSLRVLAWPTIYRFQRERAKLEL